MIRYEEYGTSRTGIQFDLLEHFLEIALLGLSLVDLHLIARRLAGGYFERARENPGDGESAIGGRLEFQVRFEEAVSTRQVVVQRERGEEGVYCLASCTVMASSRERRR